MLSLSSWYFSERDFFIVFASKKQWRYFFRLLFFSSIVSTKKHLIHENDEDNQRELSPNKSK
jgi:hypothetical protein